MLGDFNADCQYVSKKAWPSSLEPEKMIIVKETVSSSVATVKQQKKQSITAMSITTVKTTKSRKKPNRPAKIKGKKSRKDDDSDYEFQEEDSEYEHSDSEYENSGHDDDDEDDSDYDDELTNDNSDDDDDYNICEEEDKKTSCIVLKKDNGNKVKVTKKVVNQQVKKVSVGNSENISSMKEIVKLAKDPFVFLIETGIDTTLSLRKSCAFDRIVINKKHLNFIKDQRGSPFYYPLFKTPYSGGSFELDAAKNIPWMQNTTYALKKLKISIQEAIQVSDHFPVEFEASKNHVVI